MARLPDYTSLGVRDPNSVRAVPTFDGRSPEAEALGKMGNALSNAGEVGLRYVKQEQAAAGDLQSAHANATYQTGRIKLTNAMADETDLEKIKAYPEQHQALLAQAAAAISDPEKRERFLLSNSPDVETQRGSATKRVYGIQRDAALADTFTRLTDLQQTAASASTDDDRAKAIAAGQQLIQKLHESDYISDEESVKRQRAFANGYAVSAFQRLSPTERLEALSPVQVGERTKQAYDFFVSKGWSPAAAAGITGGLVHESGLRTGALNPGDGADGSDSVGLAQWNSGRASALKAFASSKGTDWRDLKTQLEFVDHELRTTEAGPAAQLSNARSAREAAEAFVQFERPAGYQRGATAAHGWTNRLRQAEGVFSAYGGGGPLAPAAGERLKKFLTPEQEFAVRVGAEREFEQDQRRAQVDMRAESAALSTRMADDMASVERTGVGSPDLKAEDITRVFGQEALTSWQDSRARAYRVHSALDGIEALPEGDVERRLQTLEPKPGAPGYVDDVKTLQSARKKAEALIAARNSDPALAVDALPVVREARAAAVYEGQGDTRQIKPESAQAIVKARLTAQSQLDIREPLAVTRGEAAVIARQLRNIGDDDEAGLQKFMGALRRTYGSYADEVLSATIQHQNVNRDLAVASTEVLGKLEKGQLPGPEDRRRLERASNGQQLDDALKGRMKPSAAEAPEMQGAATGKDLQALYQNRTDPAVMTEFDATYGAGTAKRAIAEIERRLGTGTAR